MHTHKPHQFTLSQLDISHMHQEAWRNKIIMTLQASCITLLVLQRQLKLRTRYWCMCFIVLLVLHRNFMLCTRYRYICCMVLLVPHRQPKRLRTRYRCICCIVQTHHIDFTEQFMTQDRNSAGGIIGLIAAMAPTHQTHHTYFCLFILLVLSYKDIKHMINMEFVYPWKWQSSIYACKATYTWVLSQQHNNRTN